ncbi:MAG: VOC family protein [Syntrophaceae bacterium]|nr:VOC family protein [Pseudomonadota bacterium]MBU1964886.1 VOC family protein [Pseudomonadota bacterium]MBU4370941.1 VOC family protein [Pseudomonadota bacterium]MCG2740801.1 VOC family protein [Syntrophaceae bacterium]
MTPIYHFDHVHILSKDPQATAQYFHKMFDAKIIESVEPDGKPRVDVEMNGLFIFIFPVGPGENIPTGPDGRYIGLDHFGLRVDNLDETAAELKRRGAEFVVEPVVRRPGLKISFIRGPENTRIELLERS